MKNLIIKIFNIGILVLIFCFMLYKFRYAIICGDDMMEIIARPYSFYLARFITEIPVTFIEKQIPEILNINYQDFAFISQSLTRSLCFIAIIHCITKAFFKLKEHDSVFWGIFYSVTFFIFFAVLSKSNFMFAMENWPCFSYIMPILFFVLIWYKIAECYILHKVLNKQDVFYLIFLVILNSFGCAYYNYVTLFLMMWIFIEGLILKKDVNYIKIPLMFIIPLSVIYYSYPGFTGIFRGYNLNISFETLISQYKDFFVTMIKVLFTDNWFLYIPIIVALIVLYLTSADDKDNSGINIRIIKYFIITYIGFLSLMVGTIFLPANCPYSDTVKYWFIHSGLLSEYLIFLYIAALFLLGAINIKKYFPVFLVFWVSYIYFNFSFGAIYFQHTSSLPRTLLYLNDKISVFYFNKGQTAIIPNDTELVPDALKYIDDEHNRISYKDEAFYLSYLEKNYGVDVSPGILFINRKDALKLYYENGGTLFPAELNKLKFSDIARRKKID